MASRIYVVDDGQSKVMVDALTPAAAIRHVAGSKYSAKAASAREVHELTSKGVALVKAGKEAGEGAQPAQA